MNMRHAQRVLLLAIFVFSSFTFGTAQAATRTWTGTTSTLWTNPGNWSGVAPVPGDDLVFPDATPNAANFNDFPAGTSFTSITVTGAHQITGNPITLTGATVLVLSSPTNATITFNPTVTLTNPAARIDATQGVSISLIANLGPVTIGGGALAVNVVGNLAQVFFTGTVGETIPAAITKTGSGDAQFMVNNSYSGITTVNGGYLGRIPTAVLAQAPTRRPMAPWSTTAARSTSRTVHKSPTSAWC